MTRPHGEKRRRGGRVRGSRDVPWRGAWISVTRPTGRPRILPFARRSSVACPDVPGPGTRPELKKAPGAATLAALAHRPRDPRLAHETRAQKTSRDGRKKKGTESVHDAFGALLTRKGIHDRTRPGLCPGLLKIWREATARRTRAREPRYDSCTAEGAPMGPPSCGIF